MDMNKLLQTMNAIEDGSHKGATAQQSSEMKKILESFKAVEECGMEEMPMAAMAPQEKQGQPVSMNISINASGKDNVDELMALLKGAGLDGAKPVSPMDMPMDMATMKNIVSEPEEELSMEEEIPGSDASTTPDEEYQDTEFMTKDLSGGLNRQKKMHKPAAGGDNPMAVESVKERLWAALSEKKSTDVKTTEGRGKLMAGRGRGKKKTKEELTAEGRGRGRGKKK
jgi:hypothetical protein